MLLIDVTVRVGGDAINHANDLEGTERPEAKVAGGQFDRLAKLVLMKFDHRGFSVL